MNKKQCREALDMYKKFIDRTDKVSQYFKVAEVRETYEHLPNQPLPMTLQSTGMEHNEIPDLAQVSLKNSDDALLMFIYLDNRKEYSRQM